MPETESKQRSRTTAAKDNGKPEGTLAEALVAIQADAPQIALDGTNPHFKSRFPTLSGVMERVLPVTSRNGVAISQLPTTLDGEPALTTRLVHVSGEQIESTMLLLPGKPDPQGQGSALTYARRYMVLAMLGLVGDEDDDATAASSPDRQAVKATATRQGSERPISSDQKGKVNALCGEAKLSKAAASAVRVWWTAKAGKQHFDRLSTADATGLIEALGEDGSGAEQILAEVELQAKDGNEVAQTLLDRINEEAANG